ncbi:hypothetical protein L1049_014925 [Liquidambar formosana]|uniref:BED-type domain-containing protein n=1 Tax=Liquidambar formosana TaxID=63359 RepID=A0AAP0RXA1_LIQFO
MSSCDGNSRLSTPVESSQPVEPAECSHPSSTPNDNSSQPTPIPNEDSSNSNADNSKLKSEVWQHFVRKFEKGEWKATCNHCNKSLGAAPINGTSHLRTHLQRCPKLRNVDIKQKVLTNCFNKGEGKIKLNAYSFDQDIARRELSHMIIMHEYPLSMVKHVGFRRYWAALQPLFKMVSRNTIKNDIIKIYDYERVKTMKLVEKNQSRFAITTDMWTSSNQKRGFMVITAHFIDEAWKMQSRILRFVYVPCPHTKEVLLEVLLECMLDWNIDRKLSTVTLDNCSTNDAMALSLVDKWNSTYLMLQTAILYKEVFFRLRQRDNQYKTLPSEQEWDFAKEICGRLKLFYNVTELFSGTKYPTANLYFPKICEIRMALSHWCACSIDVIQQMAINMVAKFDKYWLVIHGIMGVAAVLDPRYKMDLLEFYFPKLYGDEYLEEVERVRQLCYDLLIEYQTRQKQSLDRGVEVGKEIKRSVNVKSELDHYLDEDVLPRTPDFDILSWWKSNGLKYPTLQAIAKDVLAILVSTVASESAFSTSGRLVSPHRSRLHPKTLEALMCAQNWLWAAEMQDNSTAESHGYATIYDDMDIDEPSCITTVIIKLETDELMLDVVVLMEYGCTNI